MNNPNFLHSEKPVNRRLFLRFAGAAGAMVLTPELAGCGSDDGSSNEMTAPNTGEQAAANGEFAAKPSWRQDFRGKPDGTSIDPKALRPNLNPAVPGWNGESQAYTNRPQNMQVRDGAMIITARKERYRYPDGVDHYGYTSARLETFDSVNGQELPEGLVFEYGKVEVEVQIPEGEGVFAAPLWVLSAINPVAQERVERELDAAEKKRGKPLPQDEREALEEKLWGKWYKLGGEVDFESYGKRDEVEFTVHSMKTGEFGDGKKYTVRGANTGFHTYGVSVTPTAVAWEVDGKVVRAWEKTSDDPEIWPFGNGNKLYAVINLAIGGDGRKIDDSKGPWRMPVRHLSFYEYTGSK